MEAVKVNLFEDAPKDFADCVRWSCLKFQELFSSNIRQLVFNFPKDALTSSGTPFWSGSKRFPTAVEFDSNNVSLETEGVCCIGFNHTTFCV